jgi:hypothetical protein
MDDLVFFAAERETLLGWRHEVDAFLDGWRLRTHPEKCCIARVHNGMPFLGFLVYPDHRRVLGAGVRRATRRLRRLQRAYAGGAIGPAQVHQSVAGWLGHVKHADSFALRTTMLERLTFSRTAAGGSSRAAANG